MIDKLTRFWQELKLRNVIRRNAVYAGTAFIILELVSIVQEPLNLPEWILQMVIILLSIGFIVSLLLSWVYTVNAQGKFAKAKPVQKKNIEVEASASFNWKIASYISFVVILFLITLNVISRSGRTDERTILDKSIAVLPFINESNDEENAYFINGIMDEMLINLQSIRDFRVLGRASVEQYRNKTISTFDIADDLNVNYLVQGSGQKYGNTFILRVQLLECANGMHLWGESFEQEIRNPEDIIRLQSQIAESIANELQAAITPEETQLIEKVPTRSLTAYDFYQRGKDEYWKYGLDNSNEQALEKAKSYYYKALEYDSTFAQAYTGLAWVYWDSEYYETYLSENFLDSVLHFTDIALSYNDQLSEAHTLRGFYYYMINDPKQALKEFDNAIQLNPNDWMSYWGKGRMFGEDDDRVQALENFHKAAKLNRGKELPGLLRMIGDSYGQSGFDELRINYTQQAFELDGDSMQYYFSMADLYSNVGNYEKSNEFFLKSYALDLNHLDAIYNIGHNYLFLDKPEESLRYFERYLELEGKRTHGIQRIGQTYWNNGYEEEANYFFDKQVEYSLVEIELGRWWAGIYYTYYDIAGVYAFRGDKDKAFEMLRIFNQRERIPIWMTTLIKDDPMFDSIRDEPEFQQIVRDVEAKYHTEHERVAQWLEENEML